MSVTITVGGIDNVLANFENMKQHGVQTKALKAGAAVFKEAIEAAAPEATTYHDGSNALPVGALKSDVEIHTSKKAPFVSVGFGHYTKHVARWLEFGFRHHKVVNGKNVKNVRRAVNDTDTLVQHPFFRQAVMSTENAAVTAIEAQLTADLVKASKGEKITE